MSAVRRAAAAVLALGVLATGCTTLPTDGQVHRLPASSAQDGPGFNFVPRGPGPADTPVQIAKGFLTAMQANPLTTTVARTFLTGTSRQAWKPGRGTLVYDTYSISQQGNVITARLANAHRLDSRGGWLGGTPGRALLLPLRMADDDGEWRINRPADALVVPAPYFASEFVPFDLWFYDRSGRVVVPDQVYLPRGEQTATNLVRGLLAGPGGRLGPVVRSAFPAGTTLEGRVGVSDSGIAEVPLSGPVRGLAADRLRRAFVQLAWTLGQVPGVNGVRITVDQSPVPLPDGRSEVPVTEGREYDPALLGGTNALLALKGGRVLASTGASGGAGSRPVPGPFGRTGFSLRSLAEDVTGARVAAVSQSGRRVYVAPLSGSSDPTRVTTVAEGDDLLRPGYDMFGDLWLVDRTPAGARVQVVHAGRLRTVTVPGVTGRDVRAFAVSADGTRLAASLASVGSPSIVVADLLRTSTGAFRRAATADPVPISIPDLGPAVDLDWQDGTTLAALTRTSQSSSRVAFLQVDGSPGNGAPTTSEVYDGVGTAIVVPPTEQEQLYLLDTHQRLVALQRSGGWSRGGQTGIGAASYG